MDNFTNPSGRQREPVKRGHVPVKPVDTSGNPGLGSDIRVSREVMIIDLVKCHMKSKT